MTQSKCTLWPSGEVIEVSNDDTLLSQLKKAGKNIKSSCGGCATCTDCMIVVKSGEMNLSPQTFEELRLLGNVFHITKERLSCQTKVLGDVTIDISAHDKNKILKSKKVSVSKSTTTKLKKREDIEKAAREIEEKYQEKKPETWYRHWEQNEVDADNKPKRLGGNKRVKPFKYSDQNKDESDNE